jgi:hypothetical protein
MIPLPFEPGQLATSSLSFQASIKDAPPRGSGVAAFMGFDPAACQLQVYGYREEADSYLAQLAANGWRVQGPRKGLSKTATAERFFKQTAAGPVTMVVNRWTGPALPNNLWIVLNLLPGEDRTRGELGAAGR